MSGNAIRAVAMANVLICGLAPSLADAGEWERARVNKIVVHADQTISVYKTSEQDGTRVDWPNLDACDNSSRAILRPYRHWEGVPGGILSYDQAYAALLAAKLNTRIVSVLLEGCASVDGVSFPTIQAVAIVD